MIWCTIALIIANKTPSIMNNNKDYVYAHGTDKKLKRLSSNWGSSTLR